MLPEEPTNSHRRHILSGLLALGLPGVAHAQARAPAVDENVVVRGQAPVVTLQTWVDMYGRPTADVMLNGRGPYKFVVDTGSNTTVIGTRVARQLNLPPLPQRVVHGVTGSMVASFGRLDRIESGRSANMDLAVAILDAPVFEALDGILGMDMFADRRIRFNFTRKSVVFETNTRRPQRLPIIANVRLRQGLLIETEGRVGIVRTRCIIDTGCDTTVINNALFEAIRSTAVLRRRGAEPPQIVGVTSQAFGGVWASLPEIELIGLKMKRLTVAAADVPVFGVWGLANTPAMLVGMDILTQVETLIIDYRRRQVEIKMLSNLISGRDDPVRG